jgi:hypothetical protein
VGQFGVATFFNDEVLTIAPTDAFSFCPPSEDNASPAVFHAIGDTTVLPLSLLPQAQQQAPQSEWALGLLWQFPYLLHVDYETFLAGAVTAVGFTLPFGKASPADEFFGSPEWNTQSFPLNDVLLRCTRFCDAPTFDSAGVYNVLQIWNIAFENTCYRPKYPVVGDGGFPSDP